MKMVWAFIKAFFKYTFIFLVIFFLMVTQSNFIGDKTTYVIQYLIGESDIHFRYIRPPFLGVLVDYHHIEDFTIENQVLESKVVNDILYVYGITGYTKIYLTFKTDIEKVANKRYDVNYLERPPTSGKWNKISQMKEYYKDGFIIKEDFSDFTDEDIKNFVELTKKQKKYEDPYYMSWESIYANPEDVRRGNTELTQLLYKEYEKRFGKEP